VTPGRTRHIVAAVALGAVLLGACGGGSGPKLSIAAFKRKANTECQSLKAASDAFQKAQSPTAEGKAVARYMRTAADRLRMLVRRVDELVPPDELAADVDSLLGVLSDYADGIDHLASTVKVGERFQDVLQKNAPTVNRLNKLATRAFNLVGTLGLVGCVLPG